MQVKKLYFKLHIFFWLYFTQFVWAESSAVEFRDVVAKCSESAADLAITTFGQGYYVVRAVFYNFKPRRAVTQHNTII